MRILLLLSYNAFPFLISANAASVFCSQNVYGSPTYSECASALLNIPDDAHKRLFVEPQLRSALPDANWVTTDDPRSQGSKQDIVQIPKWWNVGKCNIALSSYARAGSRVSVSSSRWSDVGYEGEMLCSSCLESNKQGGAAIIENIGGTPGLSLFIWEDGAPFDRLMNNYMSASFPHGLDPTNPMFSMSIWSNTTNMSQQ